MKYILSISVLLSSFAFSAMIYEFDNEADEVRFNDLIKGNKMSKMYIRILV